MDGLSKAVNAVAIIEIACSLGLALKDYYENVGDAVEDAQKLFDSIIGLRNTPAVILDFLGRKRESDALNAAFFNDLTGPFQTS